VGFSTQLGAALAASGGIAVAGAPQADFFEGKARIYARERGGEWRAGTSVSDTSSVGLPAITGGEARCQGGKAGGFDCRDADLVSFLPKSAC
jgi:hypothetical protein